MPIDYSRWDGLEISDDDDFECHPNVDKASMIRWKQADIHRKRRANKDNIEALKRELEVIDESLRSLNKDLEDIDEDVIRLEDIKKDTLPRYKMIIKRADDMYEEEITKDRDQRWGPPVKDEFVMSRIDIGEEMNKVCEIPQSCNDPQKYLSEGVQGIIKMLERRREIVIKYVKSKNEEAARTITFDDLSTGFNKTIITQKPPRAENEKTIHDSEDLDDDFETSNIEDPTSNGNGRRPTGFDIGIDDMGLEDDADYITDEDASKYARLESLDDTKRFLMQHPRLIDAKFSDMVLVEAFKLGMVNKMQEAKLCVRQSSIIRYILALGSVDLEKAIDLLTDGKRYSSHYFYTDVARTCERIANRASKLRSQSDRNRKMLEEYVESTRNPDGTYPLPNNRKSSSNTPEDIEREEIFKSLPSHVQKAIILRNTDGINKYLVSLSLEEGEKVLADWNRVGLVTIESTPPGFGSTQKISSKFPEESSNIPKDLEQKGTSNLPSAAATTS